MLKPDEKNSNKSNFGAKTPYGKHQKSKFNSFMSINEVQEKMKSGEVIEGILRINPKSYEDAYISAPVGGMDIFISGVRDRNTALNGDCVAVKINPPQSWKILHSQLDAFLENNVEYKELLHFCKVKNENSNLSTNCSSKKNTKNEINNYFKNVDSFSGRNEKVNVDSSKEIYKNSEIDVAIECENILDSKVQEWCDFLMLNKGGNQLKSKNKGKNPKNEPIKLSTCSGVVDEPQETFDDSRSVGFKPVRNKEFNFTDLLNSHSDSSDKGKYLGSKKSMPVNRDNLSTNTKKTRRAQKKERERVCDSLAKSVAQNQIKSDKDLTSGCKLKDEESNKINVSEVSQPDIVVSRISEISLSNNISSKVFSKNLYNENNDNLISISTSTDVYSSLPIKGAAQSSLSGIISTNFDISQCTAESEKRSVVVAPHGLEKGLSSDNESIINIHEVESIEEDKGDKLDALTNIENLNEAIGFTVDIHNYIPNKTSQNSLKSEKLENSEIEINESVDNKQNFSSEKEPQKVSVDLKTTKFTEPLVNKSPEESKAPAKNKAPGKNKTDRKNKSSENNKQKENHLELDIIELMKIPSWENFVQKTARVVKLLHRNHSMLSAGVIKPFSDGNPYVALFSPFDCRIPRMKIQIKNCPSDFTVRPADYAKVIHLAKITDWNEPNFAYGQLVRNIGYIGDIDAEMEALLYENDVDNSEFGPEIMRDLPSLPWTIPEEEISSRLDLRDNLIFTIDPSTARDLDDAVSCLQLESGNYRVGVHIADVSYFLRPNTHLDSAACLRATSVYMPHSVIPMLPRELCESLCSLNPGDDKLSFSFIWELTPNGEIQGEWYGKTIIRSAVKLSYDHAQAMIETPQDQISPENFPKVENGFAVSEVSWVVQNLHSIATELRKKRFDNGALALDQLRLAFSLDERKKTPNGLFIYEVKDSNRLIEEFMLLANMAAAHNISQKFPKLALLRKHTRPHEVALRNSLEILSQNGIVLDGSTSATLHESIHKYRGDGPVAAAKLMLIVQLCSKPMQLARYFCTGSEKEGGNRHHYALNVSCYTHFTSPIRRYADVVVHRLLAAAADMERNPLPDYQTWMIQKVAENCNVKKQAAKVVQEQTIELFLAQFIRNIKEMVEEAIIIGVLDKSIDVLIPKLGVVKRCYLEKLDIDSMHYEVIGGKATVTIEWAEDDRKKLPKLVQKLTYFEFVTVVLKPFENGALKFNVFLLRPETDSRQKVENETVCVGEESNCDN